MYQTEHCYTISNDSDLKCLLPTLPTLTRSFNGTQVGFSDS
uniref:Uncharacterized protein n=1 Tax=Anguilla anguilla TaxID=7936 RepID=A0A0E9WFU5_ANGAN